FGRVLVRWARRADGPAERGRRRIEPRRPRGSVPLGCGARTVARGEGKQRGKLFQQPGNGALVAEIGEHPESLFVESPRRARISLAERDQAERRQRIGGPPPIAQ